MKIIKIMQMRKNNKLRVFIKLGQLRPVHSAGRDGTRKPQPTVPTIPPKAPAPLISSVGLAGWGCEKSGENRDHQRQAAMNGQIDDAPITPDEDMKFDYPTRGTGLAKVSGARLWIV